jgi:signal transduction histidine kinase
MSALGAESVRPALPRHVAWAERIGEERERRRVEAERLRIARELHDVVGFGFAAISLQAGVAVQALDRRPEQAAEALQAIKAASKEALEELRAILGLLRQPDGPCGSTPGVRDLDALVRTARTAGVSASLVLSGSPRPVPVAVDHAAYRIVQEALTNVLRHAGPVSATVSVSVNCDRLIVSVENESAGEGGAVRDASPESGYGIVGMRERANALGGGLEAGPRPGGGFRVSASFPLGLH